MTKMKKVVITAFGDESKLAIVESDLPDPAAGEVQLSVEYTIVAGRMSTCAVAPTLFRKAAADARLQRHRQGAPQGEGCSKFKVGDCSACLSKYEGQAELINLPEKYLVPVPDGVDARAAVALILDWVTAYEMLRAAHVKAGDKIFVHALSGAVGGALLRLGQLEGAEVFGTASSKKHSELRQLGTVPFDYSNKDWIVGG